MDKKAHGSMHGKYNNRSTGARYERKAGEYLSSIGYEIIEYNYRCRMGEIDIIAREDGYLVFCEVKYRAGGGQGYPEEAVGPRKQRTISKCAAYYLMENHLSEIPCRFDVVAIESGRIRLIRNAFDFSY